MFFSYHCWTNVSIGQDQVGDFHFSRLTLVDLGAETSIDVGMSVLQRVNSIFKGKKTQLPVQWFYY